MADDLLYHYTSAAGFQGIVGNSSLWMTDIEFLNDVKEGVEFFDIVSKVLDENPVAAENPDVRDFIEEMIRNISEMAEDIYLYSASFSKSPDLLSQWRGYCPAEGGYCLGFDEEILSLKECKGEGNHSINEILSFSSHDCIYDKESKNELATAFVKDFISWFFPAMQKRINGNDDDYKSGFIERLKEVCVLMTKIKNEHFKEEGEIRIVCIAYQNIKNIPSFRQKGNLIIPYLTLPFNPDYLKKIIIGPCSDQGFSEKSITRYLSSFGDKYKHVKIECSDIPYRQL